MAYDTVPARLTRPTEKMSYDELVRASNRLNEILKNCVDAVDRELLAITLARIEIEISNHEAEVLRRIACVLSQEEETVPHNPSAETPQNAANTLVEASSKSIFKACWPVSRAVSLCL